MPRKLKDKTVVVSERIKVKHQHELRALIKALIKYYNEKHP